MTHEEKMFRLNVAVGILNEILEELRGMNKELEDSLTVQSAEDIINAK